MQTLTLEEAAKLLHAGKETFRQLAAEGVIRGVRVGRRWLFVKEDLLEDIRRLYGKKCITEEFVNTETGKPVRKRIWLSTNEKAPDFGSLDSPLHLDDEYNEALAQRKLRRRKN